MVEPSRIGPSAKRAVEESYEGRIGRVVAYVFDHLDDDLDLDRLAEIACLSPWHWHRVYAAMRGETIAATVKRLRLDRAATALVQTPLSIDAIAKRSGYPNLQSFTRIFKSVYGMPPATYRRKGSHTQFCVAAEGGRASTYDVRIETMPPMTAVTVEHIGPYMEIHRAFDRLLGWLGARQLLGADLRLFGIFYDDVATVPGERLRSRAAAAAPGGFPMAAPVERVDLPGGDYAVLRHKGPYADMRAAYAWLYGAWLPRSGREPADGPNLEEYLNSPRDTAPTELLSDLYLPLR
jgi:AraC family transcriptional regulator